ncbi:MAG: DMT family transporter [Halofilum sp. (in: g-proteobacteria)]|nr:DMT family transporter [Halofilum sp. (in: g-proteobacteria)]
MSPVLTARHRGRLCAFGSAVAFGTVAPLAGLAYAGGASPGSVVLARLLFGAVAAALAVAALRRRWSLRRSEWGGTALVAVAWVTVTVAYTASFYYIPVSLAVLLFFTFPVLIALVSPLVDGRRPEPVTLGAALVAFAGLALALGPDLGGLDWRGCALGALAALGGMSTFILSRRLVVEQDMFAFSFHLHTVCVLAVLLALALTGAPDLPVRGSGWLGLLGVGGFYVAAVLLQFAAIRLAGPARASLVFNAEPIVTMLGAGLILGERLGPWQLAGAALVITAVLWSTRADRPES